MIRRIIRLIFIAMNTWQNSLAVLLSRYAARRNACGISPTCNYYHSIIRKDLQTLSALENKPGEAPPPDGNTSREIDLKKDG